jgi:hypothetical protein
MASRSAGHQPASTSPVRSCRLWRQATVFHSARRDFLCYGCCSGLESCCRFLGLTPGILFGFCSSGVEGLAVSSVSLSALDFGPVCGCFSDHRWRFLLVLLVDCCRVKVGLVLSYRIKKVKVFEFKLFLRGGSSNTYTSCSVKYL